MSFANDILRKCMLINHDMFAAHGSDDDLWKRQPENQLWVNNQKSMIIASFDGKVLGKEESAMFFFRNNPARCKTSLDCWTTLRDVLKMLFLPYLNFFSSPSARRQQKLLFLLSSQSIFSPNMLSARKSILQLLIPERSWFFDILPDCADC